MGKRIFATQTLQASVQSNTLVQIYKQCTEQVSVGT